jgi:NAD(P)-dependent dehydrogenase (short-subunit alcohol dehydrogenase family)
MAGSTSNGPAILVTGASRGLGAAAARRAARLGAGVALMARSAGDLEAVAGEIRDAGGRALVVVGDVSLPGDCARVVADTVEHFGRLDGLVNNAGILGPIGPLVEADVEGYEQNWAVNVLGPLLMARKAIPHLRRSKGRILNVSSGAAVHAIEGWGAYCLAKGAVNQLTRMIAAEEPDVTAISFRPGVVDTEMQALIREQGGEGMPEEVHRRFVGYHRQGQLLPPEVPGCVLAALVLRAPAEWSGAFLSWDEEEVRALAEQAGCSL